jgi:hypothetical protein
MVEVYFFLKEDIFLKMINKGYMPKTLYNIYVF